MLSYQEGEKYMEEIRKIIKVKTVVCYDGAGFGDKSKVFLFWPGYPYCNTTVGKLYEKPDCKDEFIIKRNKK